MKDTDRRAIRARRVALSCSLVMLGALGSLRAAEPAIAEAPALDELHMLAGLEPVEVAAPASIEQLRSRIAAVLAREGVPGVGLALVDVDGVRWAGGVGLADVASQRPVEADTQFRVASITKSVVALGVMRLVEQRKLTLSQPLAELMPDVAVGNDWPDSPITLAHALEHTAGFDDMRFNEYFGTDGIRPRDALALNPRSREARWRPGSRMSYSNPGYTIAGHAIEVATGERYDQWLEREVLTPLGMPTARFQRTAEFGDRLATGYVDRERLANQWEIAHAPAGALLASPRELAGLVAFWLRRDGQSIVGPASLDRIERTGTLPFAPIDTNYGLGNYGDVLHRARGRGHDGGLPGFLSCYRYFPELGVGYVMLLNGTHSQRAYVEIRALLFAYLTRGKVLPEPPIGAPDREAIAAASGYYGFANPRGQLFGFAERATVGLSLRPDPHGIAGELLSGKKFTLVPTGDGGYRFPHESGTSVRVATDREGNRIVNAGWAYFEEGSYAWARGRFTALQAAFLLVHLAPLWALVWALRAGIGALRGRKLASGEAALHLLPALASLLFLALPLVLIHAHMRDALATANALSVGLCVATLAFAAASAAAMSETVRAWVAKALPWYARLIPSAAAIACFGLTLWLLWHGIIGLRTWAY